MKILIFISVSVLLCERAIATPLDDYVWKHDPHYKYEILEDYTYESPGLTSYVLNMTSQKWLSENDSDKSVWYHYLTVHIPDDLDPKMKDHGVIFVDGDKNGPTPPESTDVFVAFMRMLALSTRSVTGCLKQIPNAPVVFKKDPAQKSRSEDSIIAYTWKHFLDDSSDPDWLLYLPMVKAVVRGMDTMTDFVNKTVGLNMPNFCRGWTTWLTAAVDTKRVKCIMPIVMDELNFVKNLHHHYRAYGGWSFAFGSYWSENITQELDNPATQKMADIIDPYSYRDRLKMPKMVFSTGGDEFFLPDDSHYYFQDMIGQKYVNMLPNAEHTCAGHYLQILFNVQSFFLSTVQGIVLPQAKWIISKTATGGVINVTTTHVPQVIRSWHATTISTKRRDFRLFKQGSNGDKEVQPNLWSHAEVTKHSDYEYSAEMQNPALGWGIFFIQMTFVGADETVFEFSTETNVVPDTFPFDDCVGDSCKGTLV